MIQTIANCKILELPKIQDKRGTLTYLEALRHVPFEIRRAYWIYDVPGGEVRGGHAYKTLEEVIIAVSGSFDVAVNDGEDRRIFTMNRAYFGLYTPGMIWRDLENFSTNAVCLALASNPYDAGDYVRDHKLYRQLQKSGRQNDHGR